MMKARVQAARAMIFLLMAGCLGAGCSAEKEAPPPRIRPVLKPAPRGPARLVLVEKPIRLQDEEEPFKISVTFEFELPRRPRRARLLLRYSGVPGALSEDYKMGRFRHKVELNDRYLMDLNTHSEAEDRVVEYTKWISVRMFKRRNKLVFLAGDDGNREARPNHDEFDLRSVILEFDW